MFVFRHERSVSHMCLLHLIFRLFSLIFFSFCIIYSNSVYIFMIVWILRLQSTNIHTSVYFYMCLIFCHGLSPFLVYASLDLFILFFLAPYIVGFWPFDHVTRTADVTGNGNHAVVHGNVQHTHGVNNESNGAIAFPGWVVFQLSCSFIAIAGLSIATHLQFRFRHLRMRISETFLCFIDFFCIIVVADNPGCMYNLCTFIQVPSYTSDLPTSDFYVSRTATLALKYVY